VDVPFAARSAFNHALVALAPASVGGLLQKAKSTMVVVSQSDAAVEPDQHLGFLAMRDPGRQIVPPQPAHIAEGDPPPGGSVVDEFLKLAVAHDLRPMGVAPFVRRHCVAPPFRFLTRSSELLFR
jgi:hypothetical protein